MSYVATAVTRGKEDWAASEVDLSGVSDLEEVADVLRELAPEAEISLLFVEADDTYLAIVRLDNGEDLRVFGTDAAFARESRLGALLLADLEPPALEGAVPGAGDRADTTGAAGAAGAAAGAGAATAATPQAADTSGEQSPPPDVEPVGDAELLADLEMPGSVLLMICAREGMLPSDITAEVAQAIGCGDEIEELREA